MAAAGGPARAARPAPPPPASASSSSSSIGVGNGMNANGGMQGRGVIKRVGKGQSGWPDYEKDESSCHDFLSQFTDHHGQLKYVHFMQRIANRETKCIDIDLQDVAAFRGDEEFVNNIQRNTLRYVNLFAAAVDKLLPQPTNGDLLLTDPSEILQQHRQQQLEKALHEHERKRKELINSVDAATQAANASAVSSDEFILNAGGVNALDKKASDAMKMNPFPYELIRNYELHIVPGNIAPPSFSSSSNSRPSSPSNASSFSSSSSSESFRSPYFHHLRDIKAGQLGSLVSVRGIVTRVSDVQPLVRVVAYLCNTCGHETYQTVDASQFMPLQVCPSPICRQNQTSGELQQQTRGSRFARYQMAKLQELPSEVPMGNIPRTISLRLFGQLTRTCKPGDFVNASGIFLPTPYSGYRGVRAGLTTDTFLHVQTIVPSKKTLFTEVDDDLKAQIAEAVNPSSSSSSRRSIVDRLAASIAPEIHGHLDIKRALLLVLAGGVTKSLADGLTIRGDINVLLCGDPGVAKSQLLKHITHLAPRSVYTTGKGSSGVGLTASVLRDGVTGDMTLEGGALVLADRGLCCIDEFDKMEESDRTAIHEVMEQQTVSIAKAGITTTLNARTSVIAAANPVWGRWRPRFSIEDNVGLPTALLSRFDLLFLILDTPNEERDEALARHVTHVHMFKKAPSAASSSESGDAEPDEPFSPAFIRAYIARAKEFDPYIPPELTDYLAGNYWQLRKESSGASTDNDLLSSSLSSSSSSSSSHSMKNTRQNFVTARSLLSVLRCSQALARLNLREVVARDDVEEALRLLRESRIQAEEAEDGARGSGSRRDDAVSAIYEMIRSYAETQRTNKVSRRLIREKAIAKRFTDAQVAITYEQYSQLGVWNVTNNYVCFVNSDFDEHEHADRLDDDDDDI